MTEKTRADWERKHREHCHSPTEHFDRAVRSDELNKR